jgi:Methyltransferase domain
MSNENFENRYVTGKYLQDTKTWHIEDSPYKYNIISKAISRSKISFESCADVGCGAGLIVDLLANEFTTSEFTGYELSTDVEEFWNSRPSRNNLKYSHENIIGSNNFFDLITCIDVFEHVEDYFGFLRGLKNHSRYFIFNIPLDMCVAKLMSPGIRNARASAGHLHYFNKYTAIETLCDVGYDIVDAQLYTAFLSVPPRNVKQLAILPFRIASLAFGKSFSAMIFGGMSLLVVARVP